MFDQATGVLSAPKDKLAELAPLAIRGPSHKIVKLTTRQVQILRAVAWGRTADEIAEWLGISSRTVEIHRRQVIHRLGARNAADAIRIALTSGFDFRPEPGGEDRSGDLSVDLVLLGNEEQFVSPSAAPACDEAKRGRSSRRRVLVDTLVRAIGFSDKGYPERMHWLRDWVRVESEYIYTPWDARMLSQSESRFEVLVVHGSDARRVGNTLLKFRRVYPSKIVIALLGTATPIVRAMVYRAGADGVYTLTSEPEEAAAWLSRALGRQTFQRHLHDRNAGLFQASSSRLAQLIGEHKLTRFERLALSMLEEAKGNLVTYASLAAAFGRGDPADSVRAIQVYVSRLNDKLNGFPRLENIRGCGYRITEAAFAEALEYWR